MVLWWYRINAGTAPLWPHANCLGTCTGWYTPFKLPFYLHVVNYWFPDLVVHSFIISRVTSWNNSKGYTLPLNLFFSLTYVTCLCVYLPTFYFMIPLLLRVSHSFQAIPCPNLSLASSFCMLLISHIK